jgi:hypothetical protein
VSKRDSTYRVRPARKSGRPPAAVNWGRLVIAIAVLHFGLAAVVLVAFEVVLPAIGNAQAASPSGINYGSLFGNNLIRPLGWWIAGALVVLAPVNFLFRAADVWSDNISEWIRSR